MWNKLTVKKRCELEKRRTKWLIQEIKDTYLNANFLNNRFEKKKKGKKMAVVSLLAI